MPCFFISADAKLILVSRGVVAKTNLTHHYAGIRCGLINQRGVITAVLTDSNIGVFSVPLVDGGIVSETILSQFNSTVIRTLAYIGAVTITALGNGRFRFTGIALQSKRSVSGTVLINAQRGIRAGTIAAAVMITAAAPLWNDASQSTARNYDCCECCHF